jgi:UDP-4-amino-4,6-dideoxy-N-acetyl-beta-L-altrosamine N-acetyltransferase
MNHKIMPSINLRDVKIEDKERIRNWRNLPEVRKFMYNDHHITRQEHEEWFNRIVNDSTCRYWIIVFDENDVGLACIYRVAPVHRTCYWSLYIADSSFRGKGIGGTVEYLIMKHVFDELGFNKLSCEVLAENELAVNLYKSFGFQTEGVLREQIVKEGQPADVFIMGILREVWESKRFAIEDRLRRKGNLR